MFATNFRNTLTAAAATGLVLFGATALEATLSPAHAASREAFRASVEHSIDTNLRLPSKERNAVATVAVRVASDGSVQSVGLIGTTGDEAFDREALRTAKAVSYPKGINRDVVMVLGFGRAVTAADRARSVKLASKYMNDRRQLLASETNAQPTG